MTTSPVRLSLIIPTRNRARRLDQLLDGLTALAPLPEGPWEIVVVDNGSTDDTAAVVARPRPGLPAPIRRVPEPRAGRSFALNAGVTATAGDLLVFVDDDVTLEPRWLSELARAATREGYAAAAGRILPDFEGGAPAWLPPDLPFPYRFDLGDAPGDSHTVFGANMAFQRRVFARYGLFRTDLGIQPGDPLVGEESELCDRLAAAGERIAYVPTATVRHPVTREQATPAFLDRWSYHYGRSLARREPLPADAALWWGAPRYLWREAAAVWVRRWLAPTATRRLRERLRLSRLAGEIAERRAMARGRRIFPGYSTPRGETG